MTEKELFVPLTGTVNVQTLGTTATIPDLTHREMLGWGLACLAAAAGILAVVLTPTATWPDVLKAVAAAATALSVVVGVTSKIK